MSLLGLGAYDDSPAADGSPAAEPPASAIRLSIVDYDNDADGVPEAEPAAHAAPALGASLDDAEVYRAVQRNVGTGGVQVSIVKKSPTPSAFTSGAASSGEAPSTAAAPAPLSEEEDAESAPRTPYVIPDSPPGEVDPGLAERFANLAQKTREGQRVNDYIRKAKSFRNPDILEKLVAFFEVRESGTNYPPRLYDPAEITKDDHFDRIEARRREWEERQARRPGERVNFASAGKVELHAVSSQPAAGGKPRKSKWDSGGSAAPEPPAKRHA